MAKKPAARKPTDKERLDFLQSHLSGKVIIASADKDAVISFNAEGYGLRAAIDEAMKSSSRGGGK